MPTPEQTPTDPRPDHEQTAPATPAATPAHPGAQPTSTQQNMGDGAGIRGDYGDASQTNGLEGGPDTPATDTELTGS